ncbi:MAG: hypothetical protein CMF62_11240 [Magnetococcales bacterium]|nr:hypothetical protein [Magnetococcales bacterium]|tara:strand:- start:31869 stop:33407 length:1539 start_codon:yes stop_codon:yes gene_type:complete
MFQPLFILTLVANMLLFTAPANVFAENTPPDAPQTELHTTPVVMALGAAPTTLDSRFSSSATASRITKLLSLPLIRLADDFTPTPIAATSFEKDGNAIRFELGDWAFVDGTPFEAKHVKAYYENLQNPEVGSPFMGLYKHFERIEVNGPKTVTFYLSEADPFVMALFTRPIMLPNASLYKDDPAVYPVGLGPYAVAPESTLDKLVLNLSDHWKGEQPASKTLEFVTVKDPLVRVLKVRKGEANLLQNDVPVVLMEDAQSKPEVDVTSAKSFNYTYLGFNLENPVTGKKAVRKAIAHAIDRELIIETLMYGKARPAYSLLPESHPAYWQAPLRAHNIEKAKQILDDAGFTPDEDGTRLTIRFSTTNNPSGLLLVQAIQHQLKQAGIAVDINISEWGTFYGNVQKGNFQMYLLSWVGQFDADFFRHVFHSANMPPNGANRGRYFNVKMDVLIDKLWHGKDLTEPTIEIQKLQHEDVIYIPLWRQDHMAVINKNTKGFKLKPDGGFEGLLSTYVE